MNRDALRPSGAEPLPPSGHVLPFFDADRRVRRDGFSLSERAEPATLRVALVGTYTPRKCGIATFTRDIVDQFARFSPDIGLDVYALDNPAAGPLAYRDVAAVIGQDCREDYWRAARRINESGADAVWLQHEFGIFGGEEGGLVCELVDRVAAPLVLTLHSVLSDPTPAQERILRHLIARASRIMVMSQHGRDLLVRRFDTPRGVVEVIAHGAPDRPFGRSAMAQQRLGLSGRQVLMTFGLIGPGKGLERVIEALPAIAARHPAVLYRIVGATHPNLLTREGETYRDQLCELVGRLGVEAQVEWENRFLGTEELLDQLEACAIYVTPYPGLQQATSGTLSYAVALGKAVVSTPYVHARELLADDTGVLVEPGSSAAIAAAVNGLLDDPVRLEALQRRAYARGRETIWPTFAAACAKLLRAARAPLSHAVTPAILPGLSGVFAMSDGTGILQHAIGIVPDRRHGYCLDDNVRALMLINVAQGLAPAERLAWAMTYASFIQHAWNPELRRFRNFMAFDRSWCEEAGSDDSNGRALWALGQTVERSSERALAEWARDWFDRVHGLFADVQSPRALAFAMLGAACLLRADPEHSDARALIERGGAVLSCLYERSRRPGWAWFEARLAYDNPRLSQALIEAGELCHEPAWTEAGLETLGWMAARQTAVRGHFRPIGSDTFRLDHSGLPFDQQPLEAQAAIEAARSAWLVTGEARWIDHAMAAWRWFFGANDRGAVLADLATGRSHDGVTPRGPNVNCGAESILAFQLAHYAVQQLWDAGRAEPEPDDDGLPGADRTPPARRVTGGPSA